MKKMCQSANDVVYQMAIYTNLFVDTLKEEK